VVGDDAAGGQTVDCVRGFESIEGRQPIYTLPELLAEHKRYSLWHGWGGLDCVHGRVIAEPTAALGGDESAIDLRELRRAIWDTNIHFIIALPVPITLLSPKSQPALVASSIPPQ
jgi:hypothetical protein